MEFGEETQRYRLNPQKPKSGFAALQKHRDFRAEGRGLNPTNLRRPTKHPINDEGQPPHKARARQSHRRLNQDHPHPGHLGWLDKDPERLDVP